MQLSKVFYLFVCLGTALACLGQAQAPSDDQFVKDLTAKLCLSGGDDVVTADDVVRIQNANIARMNQIKALDTREIRALMSMAKSADPSVRSCALGCLTQRKSPGALRLISQAAADESYPKLLRINAIAQLGFLKDEKAIPQIVDFFKGEDPDFVRVAAMSLGVIGNDEAKGVLRRGLEDPCYKHFLDYIVSALGKARDVKAVQSISDIAQKLHGPYALNTYVTALAEIGSPDAMDSLRSLMQSYAGDRRALILSVYGHLLTDKDLAGDLTEKKRIDKLIREVCATEQGTCL